MFKKIIIPVVLLSLYTSAAFSLEDQYASVAEPIDVPPIVILTDEPELLDPYEPLNRKIFDFNNVVDRIFLTPVAKGYRAAVPPWGRKKIDNTLSNLTSPVTLVNNVFQGDVEGTFVTFWRFMINSTLGVAGLFDVAKEFGLDARHEDFGQTLGSYEIDSGSYIVLPFFGSTTSRDLVGKGADILSNPFNYLSSYAVIGIQVTNIVNNREKLLDFTDDIEKNSFDPYSTVRSAYLQHRQSLIKNDVKK